MAKVCKTVTETCPRCGGTMRAREAVVSAPAPIIKGRKPPRGNKRVVTVFQVTKCDDCHHERPGWPEGHV